MTSTASTLPQFSKINPLTMVAELEKILAKNREALSHLLAGVTPLDWSLIDNLDDLSDNIQRFWSPINHLHAVKQTPELRAAYDKCLPMLSEYSAEFDQNTLLYQAIKVLANSDYHFDYAQEKCLHNALHDFHLGGVDLPEQGKKRYRDILAELAKLSNQFETNLLDATTSWSTLIPDKTQLLGLPDRIIAKAEKAAVDCELSGYLLTLDYPSYYSILIHADNRSLRKTLYEAYITRASDLANPAFDNSSIIFQILSLRHELSQLLGFSNYAQQSLASNKIAKSSEEVIAFLNELLFTVQSKAKTEWETLSEFARFRDNIDHLEPWDVLYYEEKLREQTFGIKKDALRCYFPVKKVLAGLFSLIHRLFSMHVQEIKNIDVWDSEVRCFAIIDEQQRLRGQFYLDIYARPEKREGAWMDDYQSRRRLHDGSIQIPIVFLNCNFPCPVESTETALLTHEEVVSLFHEFGHGLQHMLTLIDYENVSGTNGVAWDVIEFPSQFLECFAWEKSILHLISCHHHTGEPLPDTLIEQLHATRKFQAGLQLLKQLEISLFDFRLHTEFDPTKGYQQVQTLLDQIRTQVNIMPVAVFNRFQHGFSHIFAGGYAAGYYSYLWAEVLSCDAFYKFLEDGIFNKTTGQAFLNTILEQGGAVDAIELFKKFRGRAPKIQAFLEHSGINHC